MKGNEKAIELLSRVEISLLGAEEVLKDQNLSELSGELLAVSTIIDIVRRETMQNVCV